MHTARDGIQVFARHIGPVVSSHLTQRTQQTASYSNQASYGGTTNYGYDPLNRLISEGSTRQGGYSNSFAYDAAGNPTTFRNVDPTGGAGYNADNQNGSGAFTYDGEGNPTLYNGIGSQSFDAEDRPTHVQTAVSGEANGWRADGLRGWKQGAGGLVNYLYAGGVPVCEFTGANITAINTWGPGGLLARHTNNIQAGTSANTYYAWDGLGNAAQTLDGNGNVTNTFSWDAYGKGVSTSATTDPYSGFGGQWGYYTDSETGMTLCGARFYDSSAGRWLTRDPIGYGGGINLYGYVGGNPLSFVDAKES